MPNKPLPELKKGELPGYHLKDPMKKRRNVLVKLSKNDPDKMLKVKKRLTVLRTYTKKSQPDNSKKYKKDEMFLKKKRDNMKK